jgi:selenoprotein S
MEPPKDEEHEGFRHPKNLQNETPASVLGIYASVVQFLQQYGWFLLLGVVLAFFVKQKLQEYLAKRPRSQSSPQDLHRYDSETALKRQEAFEASRRRLQEKLDAESAKFAEEQKKREEEKRKQKIAEWDKHLEGKGYRSKYRPPQENSDGPSCSASGSATGTTPSSSSSSKKPKQTYRAANFNALTGSGGGGGTYRPSPRRGGGG